MFVVVVVPSAMFCECLLLLSRLLCPVSAPCSCTVSPALTFCRQNKEADSFTSTDFLPAKQRRGQFHQHRLFASKTKTRTISPALTFCQQNRDANSFTSTYFLPAKTKTRTISPAMTFCQQNKDANSFTTTVFLPAKQRREQFHQH